MRANLRGNIGLLAAATLGLVPATAIAQAVPATTTNNQAADSVGPAELRNFSLPGTASKPSDQPPPAQPAAPPSRAARAASTDRRLATRSTSRTPASLADRTAVVSNRAAAEPTPRVRPSPALEPTTSFSPAPGPPLAASAPSVAAPSSLTPPSERRQEFSILPWLVAAFALALGAALIAFTRLRRRESYGGASFDLFTATEPVTPSSRPAPAPRPVQSGPPARLKGAPQPAPRAATGLVASRLRPSLEIAVQPLRCHADADQVVLEFELELFNTGAAPARAVLAEASLLNASATQDDQLAKFFANPIGEGQRLDLIPPMKRVSFTSRVVAPRASIQEYELGGRKAFVPVIAFNALYRWSGGEAQTSAAYVVGRDTNGDKLGPLRLDESKGDARRLGARLIAAGLRT